VRFATSLGPNQGHVVSPDPLAAFERRAETRNWLEKKGDSSAFLPSHPLRSVSLQVCDSLLQARGRAKGMLFHLMSLPLSSGEQNFANGV